MNQVVEQHRRTNNFVTYIIEAIQQNVYWFRYFYGWDEKYKDC